jgi:hypothetical protein
MSNREVASFPVEFRVATEGDGRTISGVAMPWDQITYLAPSPTGEIFKRGAFTKSVKEAMGKRKIKLFRNHDYSRAVGIVTDIQPDADEGMLFEARIAKTPYGDETLYEIVEGLLDSVSVGFRALRTRSGRNGVREVIEAAFEELSLTPMPAYAGAQVTELREASVEERKVDLSKYLLPPMPKIDPKTGLSVVRFSL